MSSRFVKAGVAALLVIALSVRIAFCVYRGSLGVSPRTGYREYAIVGQNLLTHATFTSPLVDAGGDGTPSFMMPPVYAAVVAAGYRLLGVESGAATLWLQLLNALATTAAVWFVFDLARRLAGNLAAFVAAGVATIHPALMAYTDLIWDTSLYTLVVATTVWMSYRLGDRRRSWRAYLLFGIWLGAVALLNPSLTVTYPFLVLWPALRSGRRRLRDLLGPVGFCVAGWAIALTPWTVRNYAHFGEVIYVRGGLWVDMWLGVCPEAETEGAKVFSRHFPLSNPAIEAQVRRMGERAWVESCERRARKAIAEDPVRYARLVALRALDYWTGTAFGHRRAGGSFLPRSNERQLTMVFYAVELGLLLWFGCSRRGFHTRDRWERIVLAGLLFSFSIVYCLTHVQVRFRAPMEPVAAVLLGVLVARRSSLSS